MAMGRKTDFLLGFLLLIPALFPMGCIHSESHGENHTDTADHAHDLDVYGGPIDPTASRTKAALVARGQAIYEGVCIHCHGEGGAGMPGFYPPLANSDYLMADRKRPVGILLRGLKGAITVNGETYDSEMPAVKGSDLSIAAVLTYVRNQFNGATDSMTVDEVKQARKELGL
jgi:mono/diheme cytochrome c family protein